MRRSLLALIAAALFLVQSPIKAEDLAYSRFGDFLEALRVQTGIPGLVVAVVGRSSVQWERVFGTADLEKNIATRIDTPFHVDGLTEIFTASMVLRCVEEGHLSLDDRIGKFAPESVDAALTLRQVLTHTTGPTDNPTYLFRPDRLGPLAVAIAQCTGDSYPTTLGKLFDMSGMSDTVPGPDVIASPPLAATDQTTQTAQATQKAMADFQRYTTVLGRLAVPYTVDLAAKKIAVGQYTSSTLTAISGVVSTVQDLEKFDLTLKNGVLLKPDTVAMSQIAPVTALGQKLPHGIGWFAQNYLGENVYWQFGMSENGGSALIVVWPTRSLTFIMMANSNGLAKGFNLQAGDLRATPFGKLILTLFIR